MSDLRRIDSVPMRGLAGVPQITDCRAGATFALRHLFAPRLAVMPTFWVWRERKNFNNFQR